MTPENQLIAIPPQPPAPETLLSYQKKQAFRQLSALEGALSNSCTVHQQRIQKVQQQFAEDRKALKQQIQALRESIEQLGGK